MCGKNDQKGPRPWHYEAFTRAFTRAFTSGRLEIIRPLTSHNSKIMRVFTVYDPLLCLFSVWFCFYCCHCQRGLRKLPEFLWGYVRPGHFFFSEETTMLFKTIFTRSRFSNLFFAEFFTGPFCPATFGRSKELRFSYPWVAKGIRNWPSTLTY